MTHRFSRKKKANGRHFFFAARTGEAAQAAAHTLPDLDNGFLPVELQGQQVPTPPKNSHARTLTQ